MPLKKYNTAGSILAHHLNPISTTTTSSTSNNTNAQQQQQQQQLSPSPSISTSTSPSPPELIKYNTNQYNHHHHSLTNQISSLVDAIESNMSTSPSNNTSIAASDLMCGSASDTIIKQTQHQQQQQHQPMIKSRLYALFGQIEHEFDLLLEENIRLKQMIIKDSKLSTSTLVPVDELTTTNDTKTTSKQLTSNTNNKQIITNSVSVPSGLINRSHQEENNTPSTNTTTTTITSTAPPPSSSISSSNNNSTVNIISKSLFQSKARINNLSFPKFKPNAREFIMQSIKNTSAQIVNKNNGNLQAKLQTTLSGHSDGIWDINVQSIPNHLINFKQHNSANNLLIGTASADSTARLWYLNSQLNNNNNNNSINNLSPSTNVSSLIHQTPPPQQQQQLQQLISNGFCVQQYCGHSGSVNSIRFHPRFFTDATNLILTASGDCQAHIWQSVLSPDNDSLESTSDVILNYSNCYSIATNTNNNTNSNNYQELISNIATIRSPIKRYEGHSDTCIAAEWFPNGELIATGSWDRSANIYNVETGKMLCSLQHDDYLTNVNIHSTHKIILTSSKDCTFKVWDFRDPICSVNVYQGHARAVNSAIFVNEDKIATSSDDQTLKLWDLRIMRSPLFTINVNSGVNRICTMKLNTSTTNNSDNLNSNNNLETFLCLPLDNRDIKVYNLNGERVLRLPRTNRIGHRRLVTSLASNGSLLLSASFDKQINCWSFDSNPPKNLSKLLSISNNKENDQLTNDCPITPNNNNNNNNNAQSINTTINNLNQSPVSLNSKSTTLPPFTHITNSSNTSSSTSSNTNSKGVNTLSKFIKI